MSTPNYVKEAVIAYIERDDIEPLAQMFENGIPLHIYPESKQIIANRIRGKANKKQGRQPQTRDQKDKHHQVRMFVAQLHGAGLGIHTNEPHEKLTACDIASKIYGNDAQHIYEKIWNPSKSSTKKEKEEIQALKEQHIDIGRKNKSILDLFSTE